MLSAYFNSLETLLTNFDFSSSTIEKEIIDSEKGIFEAKLIFEDGFLDFLEVIQIENNNVFAKIKYRYNFMDKDKNLIFRYDNAAHHKNIKTFPHHKHTPNGVYESEEPNLLLVLREISEHLLKNENS